MFTGSTTVVAILVVFASLDSLVNAVNTTTMLLTATPTVTPSATSANQTAATLTVTPTATVTPTPSTSAGGAASVTSSPTVTPTEAPRAKTCGIVSFAMVMAWNESLHGNQPYVKKYETELQNWLEKGFFNESSKYKDIKVSGLKFSEKGGNVGLEFKLCLVLKQNDVGYIEDKFKAGFKYRDKTAKDFEFKAHGVSFKDWKAKDGECSKCSDGGAGPFIIEGTCEPKADNSCNGLKTTEESNDCVKYCDSSAAAMMTSSFILAIGILLSFSFNIWK